MSLERALAPLAVIVAAIAIVTWLLLVNDLWLGPWLLAMLVFAHGWVHLLFVLPKPPSPNVAALGSGYPFDLERSWLIRRGAGRALVRNVGLVLVGTVFVLGVIASLATVGLLVPAAWWAIAMVAFALASALLLGLCFSPALVLGFVIDGLVVALVLSVSWRPAG